MKTSSQPLVHELRIPEDAAGKIVYDVMEPLTLTHPLTLLILVNGYQRDRKDFRALRKRLHDVIPGLVTAALDNRGIGDTETTQSFTLEDMAHDVLRLKRSLCQHYRPVRCFLLGISMGGMIAQLAVSQQSEADIKQEWDGLALISTTGGGDLRVWSEETRRSSKWPESFEDLKAKMHSYFGQKFITSAPLLIDAMAKSIHRSAHNPSAQARAQAQHEASRSFDGSSAIQTIRTFNIPVLIVTGDEDLIMPAENSRRIADAIGKNAKLVVYRGIGHLILVEEPQIFSKDIEDFITK